MKSKWTSQVKGYLERINITDLGVMSKEEIKKSANEYDDEIWLAEINEKKSLSIYKQFKQSIGKETFYDNTSQNSCLRNEPIHCSSISLYKRSSIVMCEGMEETLEYLLMECVALRHVRMNLNRIILS